MSVPYESIQYLVVRSEQKGPLLYCTFECPVTGEKLDSNVILEAETTDQIPPLPGILVRLRTSIGQIIRNSLGSGMVGLISSKDADTHRAGAPALSEEAKQTAIVKAFQASGAFVWDAQNERWVCYKAVPELNTDFDRQLADHPVRKDEDRRILARILVAVASADQILAEEEKAFLASFIDPDLGTIEQLSSAGEPTAEELTAIEADASRETILALAWALALIDEDLDRSERSLLDRLAAGLEISPGQSLVLKQKAQLYILDRALGQYLLDSPFALEDYSHDILLVAAHIGLDQTTAEAAIASYQRHREEPIEGTDNLEGEDPEPVAQA